MFQHYESEQDAKSASWPRLTAKRRPENRARRGAEAGAARGNWRFELKNSTVYIPLNTMWLRFRAGRRAKLVAELRQRRRRESSFADPRLSSLEVKIARHRPA